METMLVIRIKMSEVILVEMFKSPIGDGGMSGLGWGVVVMLPTLLLSFYLFEDVWVFPLVALVSSTFPHENFNVVQVDFSQAPKQLCTLSPLFS